MIMSEQEVLKTLNTAIELLYKVREHTAEDECEKLEKGFKNLEQWRLETYESFVEWDKVKV